MRGHPRLPGVVFVSGFSQLGGQGRTTEAQGRLKVKSFSISLMVFTEETMWLTAEIYIVSAT